MALGMYVVDIGGHQFWAADIGRTKFGLELDLPRIVFSFKNWDSRVLKCEELGFGNWIGDSIKLFLNPWTLQVCSQLSPPYFGNALILERLYNTLIDTSDWRIMSATLDFFSQWSQNLLIEISGRKYIIMAQINDNVSGQSVNCQENGKSPVKSWSLNYYKKRFLYTSSDFIGFWVNSVVAVNWN